MTLPSKLVAHSISIFSFRLFIQMRTCSENLKLLLSNSALFFIYDKNIWNEQRSS